GDNEVEMHAILAEFELPYRFPEKVLEAADKIVDTITKADIAVECSNNCPGANS
ncbi:unnamed protein product, partial [marine sediment metagenome]